MELHWSVYNEHGKRINITCALTSLRYAPFYARSLHRQSLIKAYACTLNPGQQNLNVVKKTEKFNMETALAFSIFHGVIEVCFFFCLLNFLT